MKAASCFRSGSDTTRYDDRDGLTLGVAHWISLAAAPTFATLAVLTIAVEVGPPDMLCSATQHTSPLNGMAVMYLLMSVFHSTPWLKLISGRRSDGHRS